MSIHREMKLNVTRSQFYDPNLSTPAARIRNARINQNMTIKELAELSGLTCEAISNIETNKHTPKMPTFRALAKSLKVPISYLGCFEILPEQTLGQKIKKARLFHGYNREEFAKRIGINVRTLRLWEQDKVKPTSENMDTLNRYLNILKIPKHAKTLGPF